ncbi:hypothetical protein FE257_009446 [Aspergillus nanangensis]|uniref:Uncharacterized protein n=1 Tax=Aspergillus nanangensis TaxID=2582783 RepID=A0AAD4GRZ4_ASPNN|nr:hypothetical protein FE257_009446 [Aspergillus nanangensis]
MFVTILSLVSLVVPTIAEPCGTNAWRCVHPDATDIDNNVVTMRVCNNAENRECFCASDPQEYCEMSHHQDEIPDFIYGCRGWNGGEGWYATPCASSGRLYAPDCTDDNALRCLTGNDVDSDLATSDGCTAAQAGLCICPWSGLLFCDLSVTMGDFDGFINHCWDKWQGEETKSCV